MDLLQLDSDHTVSGHMVMDLTDMDHMVMDRAVQELDHREAHPWVALLEEHLHLALRQDPELTSVPGPSIQILQLLT